MALENIKGTTKLWVNEWKNPQTSKVVKLYNISIGTKNLDDTYTNASLPVSFANNVDVSRFTNGVDIKINDSWLMAYKPNSKLKYNQIRLFINDASLVE